MAQQSEGVQSVLRALEILERIAAAGGEMGITELAEATRLPLPTIHRLLRTLILRGYVHQTPRRRYALGARLIPLGERAGGSLGATCKPILTEVVKAVGESASIAMFDFNRAVYIAHVPSTHSMRMFTNIGHRVELHATAVGKALLSLVDDEEALTRVERVGMNARTPYTITDPQVLLEQVHLVRERHFALDEEEQEVGVCCVAVPVHGPIALAMSVSGPTPRMMPGKVSSIVPVLLDASRRLSDRIVAAAENGAGGTPDELETSAR